MTIRDAVSPVDKIDADVVALAFFEDERPLRSVAGLADWRMNGALSRLLMEGEVSGKEGESLLISTDGRMAAPRLLLFGLGDSSLFDAERFKGLLSLFASTVSKLRFVRTAITIPGSSMFSMKNVGDAVKKEFERAKMPPDAEVIVISQIS